MTRDVIATLVCTVEHVSTLRMDTNVNVYQALKERTAIVVSYMAFYFFLFFFFASTAFFQNTIHLYSKHRRQQIIVLHVR